MGHSNLRTGKSIGPSHEARYINPLRAYYLYKCANIDDIFVPHLGEFPIGSYLKVKDGSRISCTCQRKIFFISSESLFEWLYF